MTRSPTPLGVFGALWGAVGVIALLVRAVVGLTPIALAPLRAGQLGGLELAVLVAWCAFMAYTEGYRGFQLRFSPFVAARVLEIRDRPSALRVALAPAFCMGLFDATRRRLIVSWALLLGVTALVVVVRLLDQPWRGIVDAGVVVGLSWGTLSLVVSVVRALATGRPAADAELPASPT
jgi:hypothetical protein